MNSNTMQNAVGKAHTQFKFSCAAQCSSTHQLLCCTSRLSHPISALKSPYSLSKLALHHFAHHSLTSLSQYLQYCTDISASGLQVALELGSYIGYSAITQARKLPAGGKLYGIELDPKNAHITQEMVQHAGLSHKVEILKGELESSILVCLLTQHVSLSSITSSTLDAKRSKSTSSLLAARLQDQQSV